MIPWFITWREQRFLSKGKDMSYIDFDRLLYPHSVYRAVGGANVAGGEGNDIT